MSAQTQRPIACTFFETDKEHSQMDMLLSTLFDASYSQEEKSITASNGTLEYRYTKDSIGNRMTVRVLSLNKPQPKFVVKFAGNPFPTRNVKHHQLDLSNLR